MIFAGQDMEDRNFAGADTANIIQGRILITSSPFLCLPS